MLRRSKRLILLKSTVAKLPAFQLDVDFLSSDGSSRFTCTRAQTTTDLATDLSPADPAGQTIGHFAANTLRQKNGKGLLCATVRTNRYLNSEAPVTQTVNLPTTGNWYIWINGTGSAVVTAGTVTATGYGTATNGVPVVLNATVAGTIVITLSGSVLAVNLETGNWATSFIKTAGAALARNADVIVQNDPTLFSMVEGTSIFEWEDLVGNNAATGVLFQAYASSGNTITLQKTGAGILQFIIASGAVTQASLLAANACAVGGIYRAAVSWKLNNVLAYYTASLNAGQLSDTVATMPVGSTASVNLGSTQAGGSQPNVRMRRVAFAPKWSKASVLQKWAQAA